MLAHLRVRHLAIIEELDMDLSSGFNALTGETGAGKSLIVTAIDLLLGRRARGEMVRSGSKEAEVEGLFDISDEPGVKARLQEAGLPIDDELLVRRAVNVSGKHRCYVNGRIASLGVLGSLADGLASVMGQREHQALLDPARQLEMVDGFGSLGPQVEKMADLHKGSEQAAAKLREHREKESDRAQRLDYLSFQLAEIAKLDPRAGEIEELEKEIERLRHSELLLGAASSGADQLYEADGSVFEMLGAVSRDLRTAAKHDDSLETAALQVEEAAALVEDAARALSGYGRGKDFDQDRVSELEDRREDLKRLGRKHRTDLDGVLALKERLQEEVAALGRFEEVVGDLEKVAESRRKEAERCARTLSKARTKAAKKLSRAVSSELDDLDLRQAEFEVVVETAPDDLGPTGADRVEFMVALNPGEGRHPLRKVASGGELSRLMLAVKRVLTGVGPVGTYVFDEVDAGIGGRTAASVGLKLREVAAKHQVICITHLPQIAGMADTHFLVSKGAAGGRTSTAVRRLEEGERVNEVARMMGGGEVTQKTRDAAGELVWTPSRSR